MKKALGVLGLLAVFAALTLAASMTQAADHLEAPAVAVDGRTDINDLYAFQSPSNADHTVLIMTVNPLAGVVSGTTLDNTARYRFVVDTDGDAVGDLDYQFKFGPPRADGRQKVKLFLNSDKIAQGWTGQDVPVEGGGLTRVDTHDDPFFFDFQAFLDQVKGSGGTRTFCDGTPTDFFAGFNTTAIVLELPSSALGKHIGVYAATTAGPDTIDRMGRPAIATVLIPDGSEDDFNRTAPSDDPAVWGPAVKASLLALSGGTYSDAELQALADILLPDILTVDTSDPAGFLNGRGLADDVIDIELGIVTNGGLTSDCVDANDAAFSSTFPYLALANP